MATRAGRLLRSRPSHDGLYAYLLTSNDAGRRTRASHATLLPNELRQSIYGRCDVGLYIPAFDASSALANVPASHAIAEAATASPLFIGLTIQKMLKLQDMP